MLTQSNTRHDIFQFLKVRLSFITKDALIFLVTSCRTRANLQKKRVIDRSTKLGAYLLKLNSSERKTNKCTQVHFTFSKTVVKKVNNVARQNGITTVYFRRLPINQKMYIIPDFYTPSRFFSPRKTLNQHRVHPKECPHAAQESKIYSFHFRWHVRVHL